MQSRKDGRRRDEKEYQESDRNIYFDRTVPTVVYSKSNDLWPVGKHYWNFNISHFSIFVLLSSFPYFRRLISMLTFYGRRPSSQVQNGSSP